MQNEYWLFPSTNIVLAVCSPQKRRANRKQKLIKLNCFQLKTAN